MSTTKSKAESTANQSKGQLILPAVNQHTAALSGMIDSVLHKLSGTQNERALGCLSVGVVGGRKKVGVSTVAHRLAMQAANNGEGNVLIVDTHSANPIQHKLSSVAEGPGMVDHFARGIELEKCIQESPIPHLDILAWGTKTPPGFTVPPLELKELFADLRSSYQYIFIDLPWMDERTGSAALPYALMADGVVIVLDGAASKESPTKQLVAYLNEHGINVLGAIMNRFAPTLPRWLRRWF